MSGTTISGAIVTGVSLADTASYNPATVLAGSTITNSAGVALNAAAGAADWTVSNSGSLLASGTTVGNYGIVLRSAGTITNTGGGLVNGFSGGVAIVGAGNVVNQGRLIGTSTTASAGVLVVNGAGNVTNAASGIIAGGVYGVALLAGGTVVNSGSISSMRTFNGAGVDLRAAGTVTNAASGTINAQWIGVQFGTTTTTVTGTVLNAGRIIATDGTNGAELWLHGPAFVSNASTGTIDGGPFGIVEYDRTTVVNLGSIGGSVWAVDPARTGFANRVIVGPGASFSGKVGGGNTIGATVVSALELASGAGTGTLTGLGSQFIDFGQVTLDAGATWTVGGTIVAGQTVAFAGAGSLTLANPAAVAGTIFGFGAGDTIALAGVSGVSSATLGAGNVLTVTAASGGPVTLQFDPTQSFSGTNFHSTASGVITVACFAEGTRIATVHGEVAVEALVPGDLLPIADGGGVLPVRWIGRRRVDCRRHPEPLAVYPVRVRAGALGDGQPHRDVRLSPDHAIYLWGKLIPIRCLINGTTIVQEAVDSVRYFHVELSRHAVILAEGLACESFLDLGNRSAFEDGGPALTLHADFARQRWDATACAELILGGPVLTAARQRVSLQAGWLGHRKTLKG